MFWERHKPKTKTGRRSRPPPACHPSIQQFAKDIPTVPVGTCTVLNVIVKGKREAPQGHISRFDFTTFASVP